MNAITSMPENNSIPYELIWKPLIENPKINALPFNLVYGKIGKELYFDSEFNAEPSLKTTCGWDFKEGTPITKKALDPVEFDFSFKQCYTVFLKSIFGDNLPDGWRKGELTPEIVGRIVDKQSHAFNENLLYALFLSTSTQTTPWLAGFEGVFAKLLDGVANVDGTVDAGAITDADLLPANIEATLFRIFNAQSQLMRGYDNSQKAFIVTQTIYDAWVRFLQVGNGSAFVYTNADTLVNGVRTVSYQGVPLINANYIDRGIALYDVAGSPTSTVNPHRAILTVKSNHWIMIDGSGFEAIDPFYERKDDLVLSPASAMIDYQYGYGELNVIAGF